MTSDKPQSPKRGDIVFIRRPKRFLSATFISSYDHFPAVKCLFRGHETLFGSNEVVSADEEDAIRSQRKCAKIAKIQSKNSHIIEAWNDGLRGVQLEVKCDIFHLALYNKLKMLKRLGIITEDSAKNPVDTAPAS